MGSAHFRGFETAFVEPSLPRPSGAAGLRTFGYLHAPRTGNGIAFEAAVAAFLTQADRTKRFDIRQQTPVPRRRDGSLYLADVEMVDKDRPSTRAIVSCKYQRATGTAEEKLYCEVDHLVHVLRANEDVYKRMYLVVAGTGWSPRFREHLVAFSKEAYPDAAGRIEVVNTDELLSIDFDRKVK